MMLVVFGGVGLVFFGGEYVVFGLGYLGWVNVVEVGVFIVVGLFFGEVVDFLYSL